MIPVYTWRLYDATYKLSLLSKRQENTSKLIQRARLWIEIGNVRALTGKPGFVPHIIVRNAGHMPAGKVSWIFGKPHFTTDNDWNPQDPEGESRGNVTLAPGAAMKQGGPPFGLPDDAPDAAYLYIWGCVSNHDGFEPGRFTQFSHRYNMELMHRDVEKTGSPAFPEEAYRYNRYYNDAS